MRPFHFGSVVKSERGEKETEGERGEKERGEGVDWRREKKKRRKRWDFEVFCKSLYSSVGPRSLGRKGQKIKI